MMVSRNLIRIISIAIPVVVALLLGIRVKFDLGEWTKCLPHLNAVINSLTAVLLLAGLLAIKKGKRDVHRRIMTSAFCLGALFLVTYVLYHFSNESTSFGGEGAFVRIVYYSLLITHILSAAIVVYFVLMAMYYALNEQFDEHKRVVKWGYPIWLYVSVTGVLVYLMISPYYN